MVKVTKTEIWNFSLEEIWNTVTSLENYQWRSDLTKIEILENEFLEYSKEGIQTHFLIMKKEPMKIYEFQMENENMKGYWTGKFEKKEDLVEVTFTEEITAKKFWMKPFVKMYLKKQQGIYFKDLKEELKRKSEK